MVVVLMSDGIDMHAWCSYHDISRARLHICKTHDARYYLNCLVTQGVLDFNNNYIIFMGIKQTKEEV